MRENRLRSLWKADRAAVNGWLSMSDAYGAEVMAHQGFDSLTVDLQHGLADAGAMVGMLQAMSATPTVPVVRVPWLEPGIVMKALDAGAYGVICPMIESADDAAKLVSWTRYPPRGTRSYGPARAPLHAGDDYAAHADDTVVAFAMIETARALDRLDDILSVDGLEAIYVGPSDLSLSLGCRPSLDEVEPEVAEAVDHIVARACAHGVVAGIHNAGTAAALGRVAKGYRFVTVASDARLIAAGAQQAMAEMRAGQPPAGGVAP